MVRILAAVGFVVLVGTFTPLVVSWTHLLEGPWQAPQGDILIVLAGDVLDQDLIGRTSYWRCVYGAMAWKAGHFKMLVVSGPQNTIASMVEFLVFSGVPRDAIRLEPKAATTRENALFVTELLRETPGTKVLLTSDFHMFRARRSFTKAGLDVLPHVFPDARKRAQSWKNRPEVLLDLLSETAKIGWYAAHGWI